MKSGSRANDSSPFRREYLVGDGIRRSLLVQGCDLDQRLMVEKRQNRLS